MKFPQTFPGAEPFFLSGSRCGCLLVHGFTGTPKEMRWMGEYLHSQGYTVLGIRLSGHATQPADLVRMRWWDWMASVEDGLNLLRSCCDRVFIAGLSMGGALCLLSAAHFPISGVIAISTPYQLPADWRLDFIRTIALFQPKVQKGASDWQNQAAAKDHLDYPFYPTRSIAEVEDLLINLRAALPRIQVPVLLAHSRSDQAVLPDNMPKIYAALGTADKQMVWVENSGHVVIREPDRQKVFNAAHNFIQSHVNSSAGERTHAA